MLAGGRAYFVKAHTRPWYDWDPLFAAKLAVRHEASAYRILAANGLKTPDVILVAESEDNPLGWPCLVTKGLRGKPLPAVVMEQPDQADVALSAVGRYFRQAHSITFEHPGYLTHGGPVAEPDPHAWQHPMWTAPRFLADAFTTWAADRHEAGLAVVDRLAGMVLDNAEAIAEAFTPPRFVTGDCHAGQVFVNTEGARPPEVTGVVDMEVASAGTPLADLFKLTVELAGQIPAARRWWEPLFAGYGAVPPFPVVQVYFASMGHENYTCYGESSWPGTRAQVIQHLLQATTWSELFDLDQIGER
jgi:aminoglycoside phosphotransferase (APT) family kinase protein